MKKGPRIYTSDPAKKEILLTLTAQGVASLDSTKPAAFFPSKVEIPLQDKGKTHKLMIKNTSDQPINPAIVFAPRDVVNVEMPSGEIAPGAEEPILVTLHNDFDRATLKTSLTLTMADPDDTRFTIPIEIGDVSPKAHTSTPHAASHSTSQKTPLRPTGTGNKGGK